MSKAASDHWSILLALGLSAWAVLFFKYAPNYTPEHNSLRGMPGWVALAYLTIQLWMLLNTALRVCLTSILDAAFAIAPVVTGIVSFVLYVVGYFDLSLYQLNALATLTMTGLVEFTATLWVRNVVLQKGVSIVSGTARKRLTQRRHDSSRRRTAPAVPFRRWLWQS